MPAKGLDPKRRYAFLAFGLLAVSAVILAIERPWEPPGSTVPPPPADLPTDLASLRGAPDFGGATGWLNTPNGSAVDLVELRGGVVLVDFWTYSCVNCIRTLPHLTAWYDTYRDHGLTIVGVHSPEFRFEKDPDNVRDAIEEHDIHYPVPQDNDFDIWDAYNNRFWPTHYLVGPYGKIRDVHIGEGAYAETEEKIRALLREAGVTDLPQPVEEETDPGPRGSDITPELYAGHGRQPDALGNPEGYQPGEVVDYTLPPQETWERDRIYLDGSWYNGAQSMEARSDGSVVLRFKAGALNWVSEGGGDACVPVRLDGFPIPDGLAGPSVDTSADPSCVPLGGADAYHAYAGPVAEHTIRFDVPEGFRLYTFAFSAYDQS